MAERSGDELGSFCGMRLSEALARRADVARKLQKLMSEWWKVPPIKKERNQPNR